MEAKDKMPEKTPSLSKSEGKQGGEKDCRIKRENAYKKIVVSFACIKKKFL